jgi:hypothetical protein
MGFGRFRIYVVVLSILVTAVSTGSESRARGHTLRLIDEACTAMATTPKSRAIAPFPGSKALADCTWSGQQLKCINSGLDADTTFGGQPTTTIVFDTIVKDESVHVLRSAPPLYTSHLFLYLPESRYTWISWSVDAKGLVNQKHCVGWVK